MELRQVDPGARYPQGRRTSSLGHPPGEYMSLARAAVVSVLALAACKGTHAGRKVASADEPWSHAYSGTSDGWWVNWARSLEGKAPFGPGTQFELETIAPGSVDQREVLEVVSITPGGEGTFSVVLSSSTTGNMRRTQLPPSLRYGPGNNGGSITARNEGLVTVTVPAGTFKAGRLWSSETRGDEPYERDEWVVADIPVPVQSWSRPVRGRELYNPPADGIVPEGTVLTRLVRIDRK